MNKQSRFVAMLCALLLSVLAMPLLASASSGSIFTTTPDGTVVNANTQYSSKLEVYLSTSGLEDGLYVFQVTDPSGTVLLSQDPTKCRIAEVVGGSVTLWVKPPNLIGKVTHWYGPLVAQAMIARHRTSLIRDGYGIFRSCHFIDSTNPPGIAGPTGRHDTNQDVNLPGGIVVQLMPFQDAPNPDRVYKAWATNLGSPGGYLEKMGDLDRIPTRFPHPSASRGYVADEGFDASSSKTDNFMLATPAGNDKVTICHEPGTPAQTTIQVSVNAWHAHQAHGDTEGACNIVPESLCPFDATLTLAANESLYMKFVTDSTNHFLEIDAPSDVVFDINSCEYCGDQTPNYFDGAHNTRYNLKLYNLWTYPLTVNLHCVADEPEPPF